MGSSKQMAAIEQHGRNLLAIFPDAQEQDPVKLCKKLRRYETKLSRLAVEYCNGGIQLAEIDEMGDRILSDVGDLLGEGAPIHFNRDPRGYALKVSDKWQRERKNAGKPYIGHEDWGGYGIIAPEIGKDGH